MAKSYKKLKEQQGEQPKIMRAPLPKEGEVIGIVEQRYGGNKMNVSCLDGKERNCRVPGRLKRRLWLRPRDVVIVEPWELDDTRGDILLKYNPAQVKWLKKNNYLETGEEEF